MATFGQDPGDLHYHEPIVYDNGIRDIVNSVELPVEARLASGQLGVVWETEDHLISIPADSIVDVTADASEPFYGAVPPVEGTDYILQAGTVNVSLARASGQSTTIQIEAIGGPAVVRALQLRAVSVPVVTTSIIVQEDETSVATTGRREYPDEAPYMSPNDADAISRAIISRYSERSPKLQLRILANCDEDHAYQVLQREISDRIEVVNGELGLDAPFFVERVEHEITALGKVHALKMGIEKSKDQPVNVFILDQSLLDGPDVLGYEGLDNPGTMFILDDPDQGRFGVGRFAL